MQKQQSILERIKARGTFQDILPDEEQFVTDTSAGGLNEEQIINALQTRRQDLQSGITIQSEDGIQLAQDAGGEQAVNPDPYGGRSKQEVIMMAFQSGITKKSALQEIGDTYDMVMGEDVDPKEKAKQDNYTKAEQFIADNPEASREELKAAIKQYTSLDDGGINSLLERDNIKSSADMLTDDQLKTAAISIVKKNTDFFTSGEKGLEKAIQQINQGKMKSNGKVISLSSNEKQKMLDVIIEEYPQGRSFLDKILPGGK